MKSRVEGVQFGHCIQGSKRRVQGSGLRVQGVWDLGFKELRELKVHGQ